jgi:hypothetical protein
VRAAADRGLAGGQVPLRDTGADLHIVVLARVVVPLRDPAGRQLGQRWVGRARVGRDGWVWGRGRRHCVGGVASVQ